MPRKYDFQFAQNNNAVVYADPMGSTVLVRFTALQFYYSKKPTKQQLQQQEEEKKSETNTPATTTKKQGEKMDSAQMMELKQKKVWELAQAPFRGLFMTAFLMYMSGNQVHIFPIIVTVMAIVNPLKSIFTTNAAFQSFDDERVPTLLPKLVYIFFNLVGLGIALLKCYYMGLLPNQTDWLLSAPQQVLVCKFVIYFPGTRSFIWSHVNIFFSHMSLFLLLVRVVSCITSLRRIVLSISSVRRVSCTVREWCLWSLRCWSNK